MHIRSAAAVSEECVWVRSCSRCNAKRETCCSTARSALAAGFTVLSLVDRGSGGDAIELNESCE